MVETEIFTLLLLLCYYYCCQLRCVLAIFEETSHTTFYDSDYLPITYLLRYFAYEGKWRYIIIKG